MHLEMVKELYSQSKNIVEDSNVKLYKQKKIFTTFNMNSQITATIGFSRTIFIKLQNITLVLGNISANIFPKILPLQVQQGLGRAPANFPPHQKDEMEGSKCTILDFAQKGMYRSEILPDFRFSSLKSKLTSFKLWIAVSNLIIFEIQIDIQIEGKKFNLQ